MSAGSSNANATASLVIGRWVTTCLTPADHPAPHALFSRIEEDGRQLADACEAALARVLDPADASVWLIPRLNLDLTFGLRTAAGDTVSRLLAGRLAEGIARLLAGSDEAGVEALRFPNRAAFLAQFLTDLANGSASGKWYYEEFDSLRALPLSPAVRAALVQDPRDTAASILKLSALRRLEEIVAVLTESDARAIFQACFDSPLPASGTPDAHDLRRWLSRTLELWSSAPLRPASGQENQFRDALRLFARLAAAFPETEREPAARMALEALLNFREILSVCPQPTVANRLLTFLAGGELARAVELASSLGAAEPAATLGMLAASAAGDANWCAQAAGVVLAEDQQGTVAAVVASAPRGEVFLSLFGGIFLLGPSLAALDLAGICNAAAAPLPESASAAALLRHTVALKCLGRSRADAAAHDAALRLFSGFASADYQESLRALDQTALDLAGAQRLLDEGLAAAMLELDSCPTGPAQDACFSLSGLWPEAPLTIALDGLLSQVAFAALRHFARRLPGFAASSPEHLYKNFLAGVSEVRNLEQRIEVRLPACPLSVVLRLAGLASAPSELPWLEGRETCLLPPQD